MDSEPATIFMTSNNLNAAFISSSWSQQELRQFFNKSKNIFEEIHFLEVIGISCSFPSLHLWSQETEKFSRGKSTEYFWVILLQFIDMYPKIVDESYSNIKWGLHALILIFSLLSKRMIVSNFCIAALLYEVITQNCQNKSDCLWQ